MNVSLIFNIGFDITVAALILFVGWFYINIRNHKKAFNWLIGTVFALILGMLAIGYGSIKNVQKSSQANQAQYEIKSLSHKINRLENDSGNNSEINSSRRIRVVNQSTANQVKNRTQDKHQTKINLVAKVIKVQGNHILARGVHSHQQFVINVSTVPNVNKNDFITAKAHTTSIKKINGLPTIEVKANTASKQQ